MVDEEASMNLLAPSFRAICDLSQQCFGYLEHRVVLLKKIMERVESRLHLMAGLTHFKCYQTVPIDGYLKLKTFLLGRLKELVQIIGY